MYQTGYYATGYYRTGYYLPGAAVIPQVSKAGGYRGMWTPVRTVSVDGVKVSAASYVRVIQPDVPRFTSPHANLAREPGDTRAKITPVSPPAVSLLVNSRVRYKKPTAGGMSTYVRVAGYSGVNHLPPSIGITVLPLPLRGKTYYSYYTPETVQNPTEEVLYFL